MEAHTLKNKSILNQIPVAIHQLMFASKYIYPLLTFRILFGALMCFGTARFMYNGWVDKLFIAPKHFFKFYGFEWIESIGADGIYILHWVILFSALGIALGFLYRISAITFFLSFAYIELLDASNYLNHYYLVLILAFFLIFLPANAFFSVDSILFPQIRRIKIPAWCIHIIMAQLCIVYFYAGVAKINNDWMFRAMPLSIWLPEHSHIPVLGYFFKIPEIAYLFSWFGALYDLTIWIFLLNKKTRPFAYIMVVVFHLMTGLLFNIGLFPWIMICSTLIFFSADKHKFFYNFMNENLRIQEVKYSSIQKNITKGLLLIFFTFQVLFPLRSHFYSGNVLWHEQGYRFSWRVMVVEKSGTALFYIEDLDTGRKAEINHTQYLTDFQAKQMCIQPDFILQYAKIIAEDYKKKHQILRPKVTADIFVALNRRTSSRLIDPNINLLKIEDSFQQKDWILPLKE